MRGYDTPRRDGDFGVSTESCAKMARTIRRNIYDTGEDLNKEKMGGCGSSTNCYEEIREAPNLGRTSWESPTPRDNHGNKLR